MGYTIIMWYFDNIFQITRLSFSTLPETSKLPDVLHFLLEKPDQSIHDQLCQKIGLIFYQW